MAHFDMTLGEFGAMTLAIEEAQKGNFEPLLERFRTAEVVLPLEYSFLVDIAKGKIKRVANRPIQPALETRDVILALDVSIRMLNGEGKKGAVDRVAKIFGVGTRTVYDAVACHPDIAVPEVLAKKG
jgi:hypothetical protein